MWVMRRGGDGGRGAYAVLERAGALIACDESVLIAQEHASRARARGGGRARLARVASPNFVFIWQLNRVGN